MSSNELGTPASQIQQVISEVQKPTEFPLEVKLETGQIYRGQTPQDVLDQIVNAQTEATRTIRAREAEMAGLRQELESVKQQIPKPPANASDAEKQQYYQTWAQDPKQALMMQLGEMIGVKPERVVEVLKRSVEGSTVNSAADEFLGRCPDFPRTNEAGQLMHAAIKSRFGEGPDATTADNLELVYHDLVRNGRIAPGMAPIQSTSQPYQPIPNIRGNSAPPNPVNDIMAQAQTMKLDDLKVVLERLKAQGLQ